MFPFITSYKIDDVFFYDACIDSDTENVQEFHPGIGPNIPNSLTKSAIFSPLSPSWINKIKKIIIKE